MNLYSRTNSKMSLDPIPQKNIEYKTTIVNFANYPYIIFACSKIMEMDSSEQNKVALYLFNSIKCNKKI